MSPRAAWVCGLMLVLHGLNAFGLSYVAPLLSAEWSIASEQLGLVFAATVFGSLAGATLLAPLSDRIGRRPVMVIALLLAGIASLFTPVAREVPLLVVIRLLVGLGFGAALPVAAAYMTEHAPGRHRSLLVTLMSTALVVGMGLAGLMTTLIAPVHGWKPQIWAGSIAAVAVALLAVRLLPADQQAPRPPSAARSRQPLAAMLQREVLVRSALLCLVMMASFAVMNFASYWLPTLLVRDGFGIGQTGLIGAGRQFATVATGFAVGWAMDRAGLGRVLAVTHGIAAALFLGMAGIAGSTIAALGLLLGGMTVLSAGLSGLLALVSVSYETGMRATAVGWVQGIARVAGGTAGTWIGGLLVGAGWSQAQLAIAMGCVALLGLAALITVLRLPRGYRNV